MGLRYNEVPNEVPLPWINLSMLKSILVGLHGSEFGASAAEAAIVLAKDHQATLVAAGIVDVPRIAPPQPVSLGGSAFKEHRDASLLQAERDKVAGILAAFQEQAAASGITARTMALEGDPAEVLVRESHRVDLLVVGKKHAPSIEWEQASRTLENLLRHTARPVLCVPTARTNGSPVVAAYDGSLVAARALQLFVATGLAAGRPIHLLTIADEAAGIAARAAEFLRAHGLQVQTHAEPARSSPSQRILELAGQAGAGLIVMGSRGHSRLTEFFFGSMTSAVLREAQIPVFLYH